MSKEQDDKIDAIDHRVTVIETTFLTIKKVFLWGSGLIAFLVSVAIDIFGWKQ